MFAPPLPQLQGANIPTNQNLKVGKQQNGQSVSTSARSELFLYNLCKYEYLNDDTCENVKVNKSANESNDDTEHGDLCENSDKNSCNYSNYELNQNTDNKISNVLGVLKRKRKNLLQGFHNKLLMCIFSATYHTKYIIHPWINVVKFFARISVREILIYRSHDMLIG